MLGKSLWDNAGAVIADLIPDQKGVRNIGSSGLPYKNIYAENIVGAVLDLDNNEWLQAENAAGSAFLKLLKADATDNTILNAKTAKKGSFEVNEVEIGKWDVNGLTFTNYLLADGSDKNHYVTSAASGTAYNLTNTSAQLVFGTSNAQIALDKAGVYLITSRANLEYAGATFASNRTVTLKLRRTNNTAADLTGATTALGTNVVTTATGVLAAVNIPSVIYTTANTNDIITIFGDVSVAPSAGNLQATEANIVAIRLTA